MDTVRFHVPVASEFICKGTNRTNESSAYLPAAIDFFIHGQFLPDGLVAIVVIVVLYVYDNDGVE